MASAAMTSTKLPVIFWSQHHITRVQRKLTNFDQIFIIIFTKLYVAERQRPVFANNWDPISATLKPINTNGLKSALVKQPTEFTSQLAKITEAIHAFHALPELGAMVIHNTLSEWEDDPPDKKPICCRTIPTSNNIVFIFVSINWFIWHLSHGRLSGYSSGWLPIAWYLFGALTSANIVMT